MPPQDHKLQVRAGRSLDDLRMAIMIKDSRSPKMVSASSSESLLEQLAATESESAPWLDVGMVHGTFAGSVKHIRGDV